MAFLIVGGCGFIGSHIAQTLAECDEEVVILDRTAEQLEQRVAPGTYVAADYGNRGELEQVFENLNITHVFHLASSTIPATSNQDPDFDVRSNVVSTIGLLDLCVRYRVQKIVFLSSGGTVYGIPRFLPVTEDHPTEPISSYGITKLTIEKYLSLYRHLHALDFVVIRAANPYGPRQRPSGTQGVIGVFAKQILDGQELVVWGDGSVVRDFFYVGDLARLCILGIKSRSSGVFNAGSGVGRSVLSIIRSLEQVLERPAEIRFESGRQVDVAKIVLDCSRALQAFGWRPEVAFNDGLTQVRDWIISEQQRSPRAK